MVDPHEVINESRPMLEWFLGQVVGYRPGDPVADVRLRDRFSDWLDAQHVRDEHFAYLAARIAAFICEYLIEGHGATHLVEDGRILLRMPVDASLGVYRDFDPYAVAAGLVRDRIAGSSDGGGAGSSGGERLSLKGYLDALCA